MSYCSDDAQRTRNELIRHQDLLITLWSTLELRVRERKWKEHRAGTVRDRDLGGAAAGALLILHSLHAFLSLARNGTWNDDWIAEFCKKQPNDTLDNNLRHVATFDDRTLLCVRVVERALPLRVSTFAEHAQLWWTTLHSLTAGRKLYFQSPQREMDELTQAILLPRYNRLQAEISSLSIFIRLPASPWIGLDVDQHSGAGSEALLLCLDVAESLFKAIPVVGPIVESTCATLKKMLLAAESARTCKAQCMLIAGHTTKMALVVLRNMRSSRDLSSDVKRRLMELHLTLCHVEQKLRKLGNLKRWRRILNSGDIEGRVQELKDILSDAYTKFDIESHVTELQLLNDMRAMQYSTDARLDDLSKKIDIMFNVMMTSGKESSVQEASEVSEGYIEEVDDEDAADPEQRTALDGIKSKIDQYRRMVYLLEREQRELESGLALVVYPVLTLPIEITARIFVDCLPEDGYICQDWRAIALSTCRLWSSFTIPPVDHRFPKDGLKPLLATWSSRAKGQLLSLTVRTQREVTLEVPSLIPSVPTQLGRLQLALSTVQFRRLRPLPFFPNLQYLATKVGGEDLQDLIHRAPSIRELHLQAFDLPKNIVLRWLTRLDIDRGVSIDTFFDILHRFPLLSHLSCPVNDENSKHLSPETFPKLDSLTLVTGLDQLPYLILPNLRRLKVDPTETEFDMITSLLSRSACVLDSIDFYFDWRDECQLLLWLQAFPSVTTLTIEIPNFATFLTCLESTPSLLPRLQNTTVTTNLPEDGLDYASLVRILQHRRNPANSIPTLLKSFSLKVNDDGYFSSDWRPLNGSRTDLGWLIAEGLDFVVHYKPDSRNVGVWPEKKLELDMETFHLTGL
ncbi:hypothetical protein C8R43DRAFT_1236955 [Mycena crocata]|nr:hypothetical protein C8R43DRAFT_1236955 [Mycena crocata]